MNSEYASLHAKTIVVIGASGFVGKNLLNILVEHKDIQVRVLVHRNRPQKKGNIKYIEGDLLQPETLDKLLSKKCTVLNLAYLTRNNLDAATNLGRACAKNQVMRLIHCSTAVVTGRTKDDWVTEDTPCVPISEYEKTKLQTEAILLEAGMGKFEVTILRPTAVFGPGSKNLVKLAHELLLKNQVTNYIRSCLFSKRSMNLVCIENVVAALVFLLDAPKVDQEIFIISDDDSTDNNYRNIEKILLMNYGKSYFFPIISIPQWFLSTLLLLAKKSNINPTLKYSNNKLTKLGFNRPQNLEVAIDAFATWYRALHALNECCKK